ncbi:MAG: tetratricopeptide repeat protein [Candidatus Sulfotelmatobacter sp.]
MAQLRTLRVISRTSTMHYKGTKETVPQIARELGIDTVVEGSVERVGDQVRIRVQLIDATHDRHLWAQSYDREFKDLLSLESTAAHDIAAEIQGQLTTPNSNSLAGNMRSISPDAYDSYLKGRYFANQRSEGGLKKSVDYFEDAIAKDPSFAAAYAGLAAAYSVMGSDTMPAEIASSKAREAASRAVQLDPTTVEGHAQMGLVAFYYDWNWKQAEQEFRRAIELNPSYAPAHQWYCYYLRAMGRLPEALQQAKEASQLDPLSLPIKITLAGRYRDLHQYDEAMAVIQRTLDFDPDFELAHEVLGSIYERQGKPELALSEWKTAVKLSKNNPSVLAALGHSYAIGGNKPAARKIAEQLQPNSKHKYVSAWDMAVLFTSLGEPQRALDWLEKSYEGHESQIPFLLQDQRLAPLRSNPRFLKLVRRVGLPVGSLS